MTKDRSGTIWPHRAVRTWCTVRGNLTETLSELIKDSDYDTATLHNSDFKSKDAKFDSSKTKKPINYFDLDNVHLLLQRQSVTTVTG